MVGGHLGCSLARSNYELQLGWKWHLLVLNDINLPMIPKSRASSSVVCTPSTHDAPHSSRSTPANTSTWSPSTSWRATCPTSLLQLQDPSSDLAISSQARCCSRSRPSDRSAVGSSKGWSCGLQISRDIFLLIGKIFRFCRRRPCAASLCSVATRSVPASSLPIPTSASLHVPGR